LPGFIDGFGDGLGPSDVAWIGGTLYGVIEGGGCTRGLPNDPAGIIRINANGSYTYVAIHEVGFAEGQHFFAMDYVEGPTLAQLVAQGPWPARRPAAYLKTIAEAIHFAHERNVLHRDLKPSNVLIDSLTDQPRVTDFGLAKRLEAETELTLSGQVLGSPNYISPEQAIAIRARVGTRSDVYSLGAILNHLLTGRPPFQGETLTAVLHQVVNTEPLALRLINPSLPRDLETICLKCLEKEPGKRCQTALELAEELGRFLRDEPIVSRPVSRTERGWRWCRRKPVVATFAGATVFLLLAVALGPPIAAVRIDWARQQAQRHRYDADVNLAQRALAVHDLGRARSLLDRHRPQAEEPDLRGFEWRYLWRLGQSDPHQALEPDVGEVRFVTFSRHGRWLAAGGGDGSAVWDVASEAKSVIQTLPRGERPLAFSPTQDVLLTVAPNAFRLWHTETWQPSRLFERDDDSHETAAFSRDGRWLATHGSILRLWDTASWTLVTSNVFGPSTYWGAKNLAFSPDGRTFSCSRGFPYTGQCEVRFFELPTLAARVSPVQLPGDTSSVVFTPGGHRLVSGDYSGRIRLWDRESGAERTGLAFPVACSPSGVRVKGGSGPCFTFPVPRCLRWFHALESAASSPGGDRHCRVSVH
jgi:eukaryotic-like serine/threonine-protein kinase